MSLNGEHFTSRSTIIFSSLIFVYLGNPLHPQVPQPMLRLLNLPCRLRCLQLRSLGGDSLTALDLAGRKSNLLLLHLLGRLLCRCHPEWTLVWTQDVKFSPGQPGNVRSSTFHHCISCSRPFLFSADPHLVPTPPSVEPTLIVPERGSPGLFGPRSPRSSYNG